MAFYIESGTGKQLTQAQLTPGQTYITSGTGASYTAPAAQTGTPIPQPPVAQVPLSQTPVSPAPQPQTPSANTVIPQAPTTQQPTQQPQAPTQSPTQAPAAAPLTAPSNGSVVDLLNSAGQDSSFAARQQLAQQFGIQGYTGTAAQNQELSKKYVDAYNANKGSTVPQNAATASSALDSYFQDNQQDPQQDPQKAFMDMFATMNPVEANIYQQLSSLLSSNTTQQTLTDLYTQAGQQFDQQTGIQNPDLALADINKIMSGTEDDIRSEIQNAGGFATESQVQALTGARNKTLIKQATYLTNVLQAKNDYVDHIVSLTQADRQQVSQDLDRKLGIANTLVTMSNNMENAARSNYQNVVNSVGWDGLAQSVQGNPSQTANVERIMGLQPGELQALAAYNSPQEQQSALQLQNLKLQNQKLQSDLSTGPSVSTQVVDLGNKKVLINSKTGQIISDISASGGASQVSPLQMANAQSQILSTNALISNPALNNAVGATALQRGALFDVTGSKSNFVAGVQQLQQQLTLNSLQNAKANGATFGALSEGELGLLSQSASKLGTWAIKDKAGNVTGYSANPNDFKAELDRINNYAKLDFLLKGGDATSIGVQQMPDGTFWTKNSDGSMTQLQ